ncbi:hypothetical protein, partial [Phenylobacterium sp.]|uniref:hypothetical protein n=1 Tax=Phenylobacterium sp. TaxID=1871053 RepID=UPI002DE51B35|nr:hypothetical protein [Phenylobacterium sp.]
MSGPTRRAVAAALPALGLAAPARAATSREMSVRGLTTYSESAMVMSVSPDGRTAATLRFCRFPEPGVTWLWCHLLHDGELYAFTRHDLPCGPERLAGGPAAAYRAPPAEAALIRTGRGPGLESVRLAAALPMHRGRAAPHGPGPVAGRLEGLFTPTHTLTAQVLEGRDEVYGRFEAEFQVGGRVVRHAGPAKFHEQRQEAARFEAPFDYSWLAGEGLAATTLLVARGASGGWALADGDQALADMAIDPPGDRRAVDYRLASGRRMAGELTALVRYEVPIFDRAWRGSFVRGQVDGRPVVGVANDWTTPPDIYAAARARL